MNYGSVLRAGIYDILIKNKRLRNSLLSIGYPIYFKMDTIEFILPLTDEKVGSLQERIEIFLDKSAIEGIYNFRSLSKMQRVVLLAKLLALQKMKVSFPSFQAFARFLKNTWTIAKSF
jgi:hypothetical protein